MSLAIYVSTYRKFCYKKKRYETPIESGAVRGGNLIKGYLRDDVDENISEENPWYGELTSLYWVWKNTKQKADDIIGFSHYNKGLKISKRKIEDCLYHNGYDIIVRKKSSLQRHKYPNEHKELLNILREYDKDFYDCYLGIFDLGGWYVLYSQYFYNKTKTF